MIIDIHGHYTTEPPALQLFRDKQLAGLADSARRPSTTDLGISDEELIKSVQPQLKFQNERGSDLTIFSPRAGGMAHHVGTEAISKAMAGDLQRSHPSHLHAAAGQFRRRRPAAAVSRRLAEELHSRAGAHGQRARLRRRQPQSRSVRRLLDRSAADRQVLVSALRKAVRARRAGDDPRVLVLQSELPPHRRALHQRRHHACSCS